MSPNTADLRQFLTDYFSDEELTTLCFDNFPEVFNNFASGMGKGQKIQLLLEHVQRRERSLDLLKVLQQQRPAQYAKRFGQVKGIAIEQSRPVSPADESHEPHAKPAADSSRPLRIFLCHSSADKPAVRELYQRLRADGFEPWLDEEDLLPGQDWEREIRKAVRASDVVIVCLSRGSINKAGFVQKEIKFALDVADEQPEDAIFLIPLKLEECDAPERLNRWQWVSFFDSKGYERLTRALHIRAENFGKSTVPIERNARVQTWGGMEFVRIPAGKFLMGSKDDNSLAQGNEKPQHSIEIPHDYWLARYPVTNEQFAKFVEKNWKKKAYHPVVDVSWNDAMEYCKWLTDLVKAELLAQNLIVRLPTEAEWEKAARGEYGNEWPWGNEFDQNKCNSREGSQGSTTPVDVYSPQGDSPYGIADMAGNVWEWCHSLYKSYPYKIDDGREDESKSEVRVLRGGAANYDQHYARCAFRYFSLPGNRNDSIGFRVVVSSRFR